MEKKQLEIEKEPVKKLMTRYLVPAFIGNIVVVAYNIVDRYFIGYFINEKALAAAGITFYLLMIFIAISMWIGVGAGTLTSLRLGQKKVDESEKILGNSVTLFMIFAVLLTIGLYIFLDDILKFSGANEEVLPYARSYMRILIPISLANFYSYGLSNIMRAAGAPRSAMFAMLIGGIVNLILDYITMAILGMGIEGTAYATLIGTILSAIYVMHFFIAGKPMFRIKIFGFDLNETCQLKIRKKNLILSPKITWSILTIGFSSFVLQIVNSFVGMIINNVINGSGGTVGIAVMTIINTYLTIIIMSIYSIPQAAQPIIGYNYGAKKYDRVLEALKLSIIWGLLMSTVFFIVVMLIPKELIIVFNKNTTSAVVTEGTKAMRIYFLLIIPASLGTIIPNYFQSIGNAREAIILNVLRQVGIFLFIMIIFERIWGLDGIWYAQPVTDFIFTAIILTLLVLEVKKLKRMNV